MARGNDDIQRLVFELETKGAAEVEQSFKNVERGLTATLNKIKTFAHDTGGATKDIGSSLKSAITLASDMEKALAKSNSTYKGMFTGPKMAEQERKIRSLNGELVELAKIMAGSDDNLKVAAEERYKTIKSAIVFESIETTKLINKTKQEFDAMMSVEKKSMAELISGAGATTGKGALTGLMGLALGNGDIEGLLQGALGGIGRGAQEMGQQAGRQYTEMAAAGIQNSDAIKAGFMSTLAKIGPMILGLTAGLAALLGAFVAIDGKVTELNTRMLENVSLVDLAANNYTSMTDRITDAEAALSSFRRLTLDDDLLNLGLDDAQMSAILGSLNEGGMLLGNLRKEGVEYKNILTGAQNAALALGVDATSTAELMGMMGNVARTGFEESLEALTQIVHQAKDAGVSTKRFFQVVQSVGGEMGLFNYRIAETAALFGRLSKIMDAQSAQNVTQQAATQIRDMSMEERLGLMQFADPGQIAKMIDRSMTSTAETIDYAKLSEALGKVGMGPVSDTASFENMMAGMNKDQRAALLSTLREVDFATAGAFEKWRRLDEVNKKDMLALQGSLMDLHQSDQRILLRQQIERSAGGRSIFDIDQGLFEAMGFGGASDYRALMTDLEDLRGRYVRLETALQKGTFAEEAKAMGMNITPEQFRGIGENIERLDDFMKAPEGAQEELENYAKTTADLQRSTLDTLKNEMVGLLGDLHKLIRDVYRFMIKTFGSDDDALKAERSLQIAEWRENMRILKAQQEGLNDEEKQKLQKEIDILQKNLDYAQKQSQIIAQGGTLREADDAIKHGYTNLQDYRDWADYVKKDALNKLYPGSVTVPDAKNIKFPQAQDAKILTRGVPLLNLAPGDIVVHQDSLAETMAGGKGQFVPDLLKKSGVAAGGGGSMMNNTFHIYGGDSNKVRDTILQTLTEWERRRSMS